MHVSPSAEQIGADVSLYLFPSLSHLEFLHALEALAKLATAPTFVFSVLELAMAVVDMTHTV